MAKSRVFTKEEIKQKFVKQILADIDYCENMMPPGTSVHDRLSQLAFNILVDLDGESAALPGFLVVPHPAKEDQEYHEKQGENYYPYVRKKTQAILCDIGGSLHEELCRQQDKKK